MNRKTNELNDLSIGISECKVTATGHTLKTVGLGSCIAVSLIDDRAGVAGLLHALMPSSSVENTTEPCKYVDSGIISLINKIEDNGGKRKRLKAKIAGGSQTLHFESQSTDSIGCRNVSEAEKVLSHQDIPIEEKDTGGRKSRSVYFNGENGDMIIKTTTEPPRKI